MCIAQIAAKHLGLRPAPRIAWVGDEAYDGGKTLCAGFVDGGRHNNDGWIRLVAAKVPDLGFLANLVTHEVRHHTQGQVNSEASERDATDYEREWGPRFAAAAAAAKDNAHRVLFSEAASPDWDEELRCLDNDVVILSSGQVWQHNGIWRRIAS
jgi:hypothetical protein